MVVTLVTDFSGVEDYDRFTLNQLFRENIMKFNVGTIDRVVRVVAGGALVALAATGTVGLWGWIGVVPLVTGVVKFCPAYALLGFDTCPMEKK